MKYKAKWMGLALAGAALSGCGAILGLDDFTEGASTTQGSGGQGGGTVGSTGGSPACQQSETMECNTGLEGACALGKATCKADGSAYDACVPDVTPDATAEDCTKLGDENCDGVACSECVWSFLAGDVTGALPTAIETDSSGNIFVLGGFNGTLKLLNKSNNTSIVLNSASSSSTFLSKFSPDGDVIWAKSFGTTTTGGFSNSMAVDAGGSVIIAGQAYGDADFGSGTFTNLGSAYAFVAKFDAAGAPQWSRQFGSSGNGQPTSTTGIAVDPKGDVVIGGWLSGTVKFGAVAFSQAIGYDAFVTKLAGATGVVSWAKQFKEPSGTTDVDQFVESLTIDGSGNIFLAGFFRGSILLNTILSTVGGGDDLDVFVAKLDLNGNPSWSKGFGTKSNDTPNDIAMDGSGNVLVTGIVGGSTDFGGGLVSAPGSSSQNAFLVKYANASTYANARILQADSGVSLDADDADNIYLSGFTTRIIDLGGGPLPYGGFNDMFLTKLDAGLAHVWSKEFGDSKRQSAEALRYDKTTRSVLVTSSVSGKIDFGTGLLTAAGADMINLGLAKFQP